MNVTPAGDQQGRANGSRAMLDDQRTALDSLSGDPKAFAPITTFTEHRDPGVAIVTR